MEREAKLAEVLQLYADYGANDYHGEAVTQLDHMYQMAVLAEEAGYDEEVVLAAFLHDIGHLLDDAGMLPAMDGYGVADHEKVGADYLRKLGLSERIASLVESHVEAKRYLVSTDPLYESQLSDASRHTLRLQGGEMTSEEVSDFESSPLFSLKVQFRRWDDAAKRSDQRIGNWERFREMLGKHLISQDSTKPANF